MYRSVNKAISNVTFKKRRRPKVPLVMLQPPPKPTESPNQSEHYIDYELDDNCSFLSDETNLGNEQSRQSIGRVLSGITEVITKTFIRQRPKRHIDNQDAHQFVTREESEYRLLLLFFAWTLLVTLVTTGLLITCPFYCINPETIIWQHKEQPVPLKIPHILVIYQDGRMLDYSTNETLSPSRNVSMKLSCSNVHKKICHTYPNRSTCYTYAYSDLRRLYIFYGNAKRDMTYIDSQTFKHSTMPGTKLNNAHIDGIGTKVGDKFIMLGGYDGSEEFNAGVSFNTPSLSCSILGTKTTIWSDKRQKLIRSNQDFISVMVENSCVTGFNRTHFLIVNAKSSDGQVLGLVLMVDIESWTQTAMPRIPITNHASRITCDVEFSKDSLHLIAISKMHCSKAQNSYYISPFKCIHGSNEISVVYSYDFESKEWNQSDTTLEHFGTLQIVNGIRYFFNILNGKGHLGYFYNAKENVWVQLNHSSYIEPDVEIAWQIAENVLAVPYLI